jgi:hypothetical protein
MSSILNPTNSDSEAGNWKPYLLTSADEFPVAVPLATSTADYKENQRDQEFPREYNRRTKKIVSIIGMLVLYYGGIMRTLVAKHNRPYQNETGLISTFRSKSIPYPQFPFLIPPYAVSLCLRKCGNMIY